MTRTADAPRLASAKATYESRGTRSKFSVEAEDLTGLDGQTASIFVDGRLVGSRRIRLGGFDLNRDTRNGQAVPVIAAGSSVSVAVGGKTIFTGTF
ncbi:MAG: hypothetical protein R3C19_24340 [Planctomycetaceae bacterium]